MKLGVNIDHIATIRQARGTDYPSILEAATLAEQAGADSITLHLREDRRHMQDRDLYELKPLLTTKMNLEMAATAEMLAIALDVAPQDVCLVPERREERTTEGGLDVITHYQQIEKITQALKEADIRVSLFIAPDKAQVDATAKLGAPVIEIHTGHYANLTDANLQQQELNKIKMISAYAQEKGLVVNAGHGLHYENVQQIAQIKQIDELNIGHAIVAKAIFIGWENAIQLMKQCMDEGQRR